MNNDEEKDFLNQDDEEQGERARQRGQGMKRALSFVHAYKIPRRETRVFLSFYFFVYMLAWIMFLFIYYFFWK